MPPYMAEWKKLNLKFDGIVTGFLGSHNQIAIVEEFFKNFKTEDNIVVIDPVGVRMSAYFTSFFISWHVSSVYVGYRFP